MGIEELLVTCPWCKGQRILDGDSLGDISNGTIWPLERPEAIIYFGFTCLDCDEYFTTQCTMKDYYSILKKISSED